MVSKLFPILFILPAIYAKIEVEITANNNEVNDVHITGASMAILGEKDKSTFGLTEDNLKKAMEKMGMNPDNMFLNSPTPWGDLFKTLIWEPTRMSFEPKKATILSKNSEQVLIKSKNIHNKNTEPLTLKIDMKQLVKNTVTSKWSKEGELEVGNINYKFNLNVPEIEDFSFISNGLEDMEKFVPMTIGGMSEITLKPKQDVVAELYATAMHTMVRVDYETRLTGNVALNFDKKYEGHRFWSVDINMLLTAGELKKVVHSSEIIEVVHFTEPKVLVKDATTGEVIFSAPLKMY
ncbi:spherulin-2A-like [Vanessa atalanta]|uniref:spherulin-2A-like n=1 Tax=Vanessa atalanta TaxID=42275 RepID=UPI001FCE0E36|nr:spherulin-2A-like [Vanessa atalanta]